MLLIFHHLNVAEDTPVQQIYIRNAIVNDQETAGIAAQSVGIISEKTILQNHPWVEDAEQEAEQLAKEGQEESEEYGDKIGEAHGQEE